MAINDDANGKPCKYCGEALAKDEVHDEFDFYKHPLVVPTLLALKERYSRLQPNERLYSMENWAVHRRLRLNADIELCVSPGVVGALGPQKRPNGGTVVMPGYGKLVEADKWLRKYEEREQPAKAQAAAQPQQAAADLPF